MERLPPLPARLGERERRLIDALDRLHTGPQHYYLNLYGPASTITVISFADLIEGKPIPDLNGRAVFVGVAERASTNVDSFYTVFSTGDGIDISGVEIAATAFANLLDDVTLTMAKQGMVVGMLLGFGLAVGFVAYLLPGTWAVAATLFIAWGWLTFALKMFEQYHLWLPLAVPLLVQVPVALFGGLLWQYLSANLERRNVSRAIRYYLPEKPPPTWRAGQAIRARPAISSSEPVSPAMPPGSRRWQKPWRPAIWRLCWTATSQACSNRSSSMAEPSPTWSATAS